MTPFSWCTRSVRAAELVAEGRLTGAQIAAEVGLSRQGLDRWKARPEFKARVAAHLDEYAALLRRDQLARWKERCDESERQTAVLLAAKRARRMRSRARRPA
jgi:hypothetical protein